MLLWRWGKSRPFQLPQIHRITYLGQAVDASGHTQPIADSQDARARKLHPSVFLNYDNLFKLIYQEAVDFGKGLLMTLQTCMGIVAVGDAVGALKAVCGDLERVLLQYDKHLWKSVFVQPVAWANFAAKIQSAVIFKDAMTHLVGKWRLLPEDERHKLDEPVKKAAISSLLDFQRKKQAIEVRMLGHYPVNLRKDPEDESVKKGAAGNPARSAYANDIYAWMALSLFRQWFSQVICAGTNLRAKDGGYVLYKAMNEGGNAYLKERDIQSFWVYFPMSDKAKGVMENHIILLKEDMKRFVSPLMVNNTHYVTWQTLPYLLSAEISDDDCPWIRSDEHGLDEEITMEEVFPDLDKDMEMLDVPAHLGATSPNTAKHGLVKLPLQQDVLSSSNATPEELPTFAHPAHVNVSELLGSVGAPAQNGNEPPSSPPTMDGLNANNDTVRQVSSVSGIEQAGARELAQQGLNGHCEPVSFAGIHSPENDSNSIARTHKTSTGTARLSKNSRESTLKDATRLYLPVACKIPRIYVRHQSVPPSSKHCPVVSSDSNTTKFVCDGGSSLEPPKGKESNAVGHRVVSSKRKRATTVPPKNVGEDCHAAE